MTSFRNDFNPNVLCCLVANDAQRIVISHTTYIFLYQNVTVVTKYQIFPSLNLEGHHLKSTLKRYGFSYFGYFFGNCMLFFVRSTYAPHITTAPPPYFQTTLRPWRAKCYATSAYQYVNLMVRDLPKKLHFDALSNLV